jgi:hypothetical protein
MSVVLRIEATIVGTCVLHQQTCHSCVRQEGPWLWSAARCGALASKWEWSPVPIRKFPGLARASLTSASHRLLSAKLPPASIGRTKSDCCDCKRKHQIAHSLLTTPVGYSLPSAKEQTHCTRPSEQYPGQQRKRKPSSAAGSFAPEVSTFLCNAQEAHLGPPEYGRRCSLESPARRPPKNRDMQSAGFLLPRIDTTQRQHIGQL